MGLSPGSRLGPYEVVAKVGAGGMGEVYRGLDTRLDRQVALKIVPDQVAADPERLARFAREAKTLAALNHTNIAQIYGLEDRALVMEFVEGEDLSARIERGPVPVDEALEIAGQIADALEAAHEFGVIHRDLKPSNIRVRSDGVVKVLDFGLAKALAPPSTILDGASSPTITSPTVTTHGEILGTAAYMAPEQARGKQADKRADIWAFGVVLYELTTGRRPYAGESVTETLAGVIKSDPDLKPVPPELHRLLRSCLEKDPKKRLRDIGDWRREVDVAAADSARATSRSWIWWGLTAAATIAAATIAVLHFRETTPTPQLVSFLVPPPPGNAFETSGTVAPDGRRLAFVAKGADESTRVWVRSFDALEATPVPGTDGATSAFWSHDSRSLAFIVGAAMKRVPIEGGTPQTLFELPNPYVVGGGFWSPRGIIVFGGTRGGTIRSIPESGGVPTPLTQVDKERKEVAHGIPNLLPDGVHFLYTRVSNDPATGGVYIGSLDTQAAEQSTSRLIAASNATYLQSSSGQEYLFYLKEGTLFAHPFDSKRLALVGEPRPVATSVGNTGALGLFSTSGGVVAYQKGVRVSDGRGTELTWLDRNGKPGGVVGFPAVFESIRISPDNTRAAVQARTGTADASLDAPDIWTADLQRNLLERRASTDAFEISPVWSPQSDRIAFGTTRDGVGQIMVIRADGAGGVETILSSALSKPPQSWSRDGKYLLFQMSEAGQPANIWLLSMDDRKAVPLLNSAFGESEARFSPDMKWIAYTSNPSGKNEVFVRRFDPASPTMLPGGAIQVSVDGGIQPRWTKNGRELIFRIKGALWSAAIPEGPTPRVGAPVHLFNLPPLSYWDVTSDGNRFLASLPAAASGTTPISVLLNWR